MSYPIVNLVSIGPKSQGTVSLLVYEWKDFDKLGAYDDEVGEVSLQ